MHSLNAYGKVPLSWAIRLAGFDVSFPHRVSLKGNILLMENTSGLFLLLLFLHPGRVWGRASGRGQPCATALSPCHRCGAPACAGCTRPAASCPRTGPPVCPQQGEAAGGSSVPSRTPAPGHSNCCGATREPGRARPQPWGPSTAAPGGTCPGAREAQPSV